MGLFDFFRRLLKGGAAEGTREAMRQAYDNHRDEIRSGRMPVPEGTSEHEAALFGMLSSRYMTYPGADRETVMSLEPLIWVELVPFIELPEDEAIEAVAEYMVWKEEETKADARLGWLKKRVNEGIERAREAGHHEQLEAARDLGSGDRAPWVRLVE